MTQWSCSLVLTKRGWNLMHTKACIPIYVAALFLNAGTGKQAGCSSMGRWINCGASGQRNIIQHKKEMSYQPRKDMGKKMHITKWKKPTQKGSILYGSKCMTFWKRQSCGDSKRVIDVQGLGGGRGNIPAASSTTPTLSTLHYRDWLLASPHFPTSLTSIQVPTQQQKKAYYFQTHMQRLLR